MFILTSFESPPSVHHDLLMAIRFFLNSLELSIHLLEQLGAVERQIRHLTDNVIPVRKREVSAGDVDVRLATCSDLVPGSRLDFAQRAAHLRRHRLRITISSFGLSHLQPSRGRVFLQRNEPNTAVVRVDDAVGVIVLGFEIDGLQTTVSVIIASSFIAASKRQPIATRSTSFTRPSL